MNSFFTFRHQIKRGEKNVLIVFSVRQKFEEANFASLIERELETNLAPDVLIVLIPQPLRESVQKLLDEESTTKTALARFRGATEILLVTFDLAGNVSSQNKLKELTGFKNFGDVLKRQGVTEIFVNRSGFVSAGLSHHFINPSGRHTERFVRASNLLVRGAEIDFIAFACLKFLDDNTRFAYVDTPALFAVLASLSTLRKIFAPDKEPLYVENFQSYFGLNTFKFASLSESLCLISASSSGNLAQKLIDMHGWDARRIAHVLYLGKRNSQTNFACDLLYHSKENPRGVRDILRVEDEADCSMCERGSRAITLIGDQFDFAGPQVKSILIAKSDAPENLALIAKQLSDKAILKVGLNNKQPRQFFVDSDELFKSRNFLKSLNYLLSRSVPAQTSHIVYLSKDSQRLANHIKKSIPNSQEVKTLDATTIDAFSEAIITPIVVAAAVIESGRSLQEVSRDLRRICPEAPINFIVGVAKSTGLPFRERLSATLVQSSNPSKHQYSEVDRFLLPPSDVNQSWENELRLLRNFREFFSEAAEARKMHASRLQLLERSSEALTDNLLNGNTPSKILRLQPGFVFWDDDYPGIVTQSAVFFTIASVLQNLRTRPEEYKGTKIRSDAFHQTLLAPANFGRFNDGVVQACFLRAAHQAEINYASNSANSAEMLRLILRIFESANFNRGEAAAEFALALASGRMTLVHSDANDLMRSAFSSRLPPFVQAFVDIFKSKQQRAN